MDISKGFFTCNYCGGSFQLLDGAGNFDPDGTIQVLDQHRVTCTESSPYIDDPNSTYNIVA